MIASVRWCAGRARIISSIRNNIALATHAPLSCSCRAGVMASFSPTLAAKSESSRGEAEATLTMPDGCAIKLPVLIDAAGGKFVDISKLFSETGARGLLTVTSAFSCSRN